MATELRNMRIPEDEWRALGAWAKARETDRTALVRGWIRERVPAEYWPEREECEGQGRLL